MRALLCVSLGVFGETIPNVFANSCHVESNSLEINSDPFFVTGPNRWGRAQGGAVAGLGGDGARVKRRGGRKAGSAAAPLFGSGPGPALSRPRSPHPWLCQPFSALTFYHFQLQEALPKGSMRLALLHPTERGGFDPRLRPLRPPGPVRPASPHHISWPSPPSAVCSVTRSLLDAVPPILSSRG